MNFILGDMSNMGHPGLDPANTEQINNHVASSSKLSDKDILEIFHNYGNSLEITNIVTSMFRTIGWYFVQFLVWITDLVSNLAVNVLTLFGLLSQDSITKLLIEAKPVLISILALSIMYIGIKMMMGKQVNKANIFTAIIVAIIFLGSLNSTMQTGSELAKESSKAVENFDPDSSTQKDDGTKAGSSLLKKNIVDIKYVAEKGFPKLKTTRNNSKYNKLNATTTKYIDINEGIDAGDVKSKNAKKVLGKKVLVDQNGKTTLGKLKDGMFGIGKEQYYRFQVKWFTAIVGLICLALGHFLAALRVASIILELVVTKIIAVGFSYALQGEKLKSTIVDIINGFVSIVLIFVCLFVFKETVGFLNDKPLGVWFIGLIAATFFMIDGPKVIERKFGYDAGLSSPWRSALAMYGAAKAGAGVAGSGLSKASNKVKQSNSNSNSNKTNSSSNDKSNNETNSRSEALNQQTSNSKNNQESNTRTNGERNVNEQQTATTNVGNETNSRTNQEAQDKQNSETQDVNNRQSENSTSSNTHQTLDQEMKESGHGTNDFKGVGAGHSALWANKPASGSSSLMSEENLQNVEKQINNGGSSSNTTTNTPISAESMNSGTIGSAQTRNTPTSAESINNGTTGNTQTGNAPTSAEPTNRDPQNTPKQANGFAQQKENQKPLSSTQNKGNSQYHRPKSPMSANRNNGQNRTPSQKAPINRGNTVSTQSNRTNVSKPSNSNKTVNQPKQANVVKSTNNGSNRSARQSNSGSNRTSKPTANRPVNKQRINQKR
ncbi:TPA: hypothetical protein PI628_002765 [Staphylococcus aureus]|uniref:pLS20_p028 family conjugation system transmembrane protein n=1 Tax=Staphylococcus saprophyticus TaxID=29385 RepID=UPI00330BABF5|nr:hypothetical protein [Staphylococcus aureus]